MKRVPHRRMPVEQRTQELVAAAIRVMRRQGVAAATTRAVTAEAGMPHGAFRFCFESKLDMYRKVLEMDREPMSRHLEEALGATPTLASALQQAVLRYWQEMTKDPSLQHVYQELGLFALRDPELAALGRDDIGAYSAALGDALDTLASHFNAGWDMPTTELGLMLYSMMNGITVTWLFTGATPALDGCIGEVVNTVLRHVIEV